MLKNVVFIFYISMRVHRVDKIRLYVASRIMSTYKIVMVRHGESEWNQKNLFCGWYDANLSEKGIHFVRKSFVWLVYPFFAFRLSAVSRLTIIC